MSPKNKNYFISAHLEQAAMVVVFMSTTFTSTSFVSAFHSTHSSSPLFRGTIAFALALSQQSALATATVGQSGPRVADIISNTPLSSADVYDDDFAETDANCHSADVPVDAIFAVDTSSSLRREEYTLAMKFVARFVTFLGEHHGDHTRFGLFQFGKGLKTYVNFTFHQNWTELSSEVEKSERFLTYETHTVDALKRVHKMLKEAPERKISAKQPSLLRMAFLITDGKSSQYDFNETITQLREFNVTMYGIGVGDVNMEELLLITGNETRTMYAENFEALSTIEEQFHRTVCKAIVSSLIKIATISAGVMAAIILAIVAGVIIFSLGGRAIHEKLAENSNLEGSIKNNPLYKSPVTKVDLQAMAKQ